MPNKKLKAKTKQNVKKDSNDIESNPFKKRKLAEIQKSFEKISSSCKRLKDNESKAVLPVRS